MGMPVRIAADPQARHGAGIRCGLFRQVLSTSIANDKKCWLFRASPRHAATVPTDQLMNQADA